MKIRPIYYLTFMLVTLLLCSIYLFPQTTINGGRTVLGKVDNSGAPHTLPSIVVANTGALPATGCAAGELAVVTGATLGQQIYENSGIGACVWTQQLNSGTATGGGITMYSATGLTVTANTYYIPIGGGGGLSTTETNVDIDSPVAATITNMYVQLSVALGIGNQGVFTFRKNAVSQSVTCTISGSSATSCNDSTHSFNVSQGDLLTIQLVTTGTIVVTPNILIAAQFGNITATGTVNTGTLNQIAFYAAPGSAVSGETLIGNNNYYGTLASVFVPATQTTTSTTFTDLGTLDTVTFTLVATTNVIVNYIAYEFNSGANTNSNVVNVDGADVASSYDLTMITGGNNPASGIAGWIANSLAAGSHTIKVRHKVSAGTGSWANRQLMVLATP